MPWFIEGKFIPLFLLPSRPPTVFAGKRKEQWILMLAHGMVLLVLRNTDGVYIIYAEIDLGITVLMPRERYLPQQGGLSDQLLQGHSAVSPSAANRYQNQMSLNFDDDEALHLSPTFANNLYFYNGSNQTPKSK